MRQRTRKRDRERQTGDKRDKRRNERLFLCINDAREGQMRQRERERGRERDL